MGPFNREMTRESKLETPFEELKESKTDLISSFLSGENSEAFEERHSEMVDHYFRRVLQESRTGELLFRERIPFAFVAVGGYGRRELCLHSDIDVLILFGSKIPEEATRLAKETLFPLWDLGFDLGYGIRNLKDCISLSKGDFQVLTSVMDARFICGDSPLFLSLVELIQKKVLRRKAMRFARWMEEQNRTRILQFGDASYLLEPQLKEGIGGLRDYHQILWLARAVFDLRMPRDLEYLGALSHNEFREMNDHLAFIRLIRNHLHNLSGRKNDRLDFEHQEKITKRLGFKTEGDSRDVEQFLSRLHSSMSSIKSLQRSFVKSNLPKAGSPRKDLQGLALAEGFRLIHDELSFESATAIVSRPLLLMKAFDLSARLAVPLSIEAGRLVREFLSLVDEDFKSSEAAVQGFLDILNGGPYMSDALDQMHDTGFLDAFIPEFRPIRDRVQYDAYHIYPVGRHLLETLKNLKGIGREQDLVIQEILSDLKDPEILFLAGLFHDLGKVGKDHARRGVTIVRNLLRRFNYDKRKTEEVLFLIRHHLLIVETATRRDLNDEKAVIQCARLIGDVERLKMLYLLTWADSKATGPRAWNGWIANLVQELFFKILHILTGQELATPDASKKAKKTMAEVKKLLAEEMDAAEVDKLFEVMPPRYLLNASPREIVRHVEMARPLKPRYEGEEPTAFGLEAKENEASGHWDLTFLAKDRPGLFADMAGVLALHNINIFSADIYTWLDGTAVDLFKVGSPMDPVHSDETWAKVGRDLQSTLSGKLSLDYRLGRKSRPTIISSRKMPSRPPQVIVDNDTSDFFTLIEIFADDRVGLLYSVTHTLFSLRLDIRVAKIATKGDQVADVFYVRDLVGQKVEDEEQVEEIRSALLYRLKEGEN